MSVVESPQLARRHWDPTRSLRDRLAARRGRDGRGLPRDRHEARPRHRAQAAAEAFAADLERIARFERKAKLLASLSHTGIAHLYGVESAALEGGVIAMELVEGEDLARRLERGRIPVGEALEIAGQIADALEQAHGTGIVHRDLKPGNIKLAPDGSVSARPTPAPARSAA